MMRGLAVVLAFGSARATLELTAANFDKEVIDSGKSAFVKFLAPW